MNNTFQINRFSKLVKRTFVIHKRTWFTVTFIGALVPTMYFLVFISNRTVYWDFMKIFFGLTFIIIFSLPPFILFNNVNHRKKGISEVMLPASVLEKFLNMMLFCVAILPFFATLGFIITNYIISSYNEDIFFLFNKIKRMLNNWKGYLSLHSFLHILFFCNLFFNKQKILKTLIAIILIYILTFPVPSDIYPTVDLIITGIFMISSYFVLKLKRY